MEVGNRWLTMLGACLVVGAVAFGFVPVTDETFDTWRKTWMITTWTVIIIGVGLITYGYFFKR